MALHEVSPTVLKTILEFGVWDAGLPDASSQGTVLKLHRLAWTSTRSTLMGGSGCLEELSAKAIDGARVFRQPGKVHLSQVHARLDTFQEFVVWRLGASEAEARLTAIKERLNYRPARDWDKEEFVAGGMQARQTNKPRLLQHSDLIKICAAAGTSKRGEHALRDEALVLCLCFSALSWRQLLSLDWSQFAWGEARGDVPFTAWVEITRRTRSGRAAIHCLAAERLGLLYALTKRVGDGTVTGPVFRSLRRPYGRLGYAEARNILNEALTIARIKARRRDLAAAYAYYLKSQLGYSESDLTDLLGLASTEVVLSLLASHRAWEFDKQAAVVRGPL